MGHKSSFIKEPGLWKAKIELIHSGAVIADTCICFLYTGGALVGKECPDETEIESVEAERSAQDRTIKERQALIIEWRSMVTEVHNQMKTSEENSAAKLLEAHTSFLSLRPFLSQETRDGLFGNSIIVPPKKSTMVGSLHSLLDDVENVEKQWGLTSSSASDM